MVGVIRFELMASWSRTKRSAELSCTTPRKVFPIAGVRFYERTTQQGFSQEAIAELRQQVAERLNGGTFEDKRFVLEALGTRVVVTSEGQIDVEFTIPPPASPDRNSVNEFKVALRAKIEGKADTSALDPCQSRCIGMESPVGLREVLQR